MEVTKENFKEAMVYFEQLLPQVYLSSLNSQTKAEFVGVKTIHTGSYQGRKFSDEFDTFYERYQRIFIDANYFQLIQIGLTLFLKCDNDYEIYPFNFYLFPSLERGIDSIFQLQVLTMKQIAETQPELDFNKWIYQGISYLNYFLKRQLQSKLKKETDLENDTFKLLHKYQIEEYSEMKQKIKEMVNDKDKNSVEFQDLKSYMKKKLLIFLEKEHPELRYYEDLDEIKINITIKQEESKSEMSVLQQAKDQNERRFTNALGFSKIWELIKKHKKSVIGHDCLMDLLIMFKSFDNRLERDFFKFQRTVKTSFPKYVLSRFCFYFASIYDTKFMFHSCPKLVEISRKKSSLSYLYNLVQTSKEFPDIKFTYKEEKFQSYESENGKKRFHEAGQISFIIGKIFALASKVISKIQLDKCTNVFHSDQSIFGFDILNRILYTSYRITYVWDDSNFKIKKAQKEVIKSDFCTLFKDLKCVEITSRMVRSQKFYKYPIFIVLWEVRYVQSLQNQISSDPGIVADFNKRIEQLRKQYALYPPEEYHLRLMKFLLKQERKNNNNQSKQSYPQHKKQRNK